MNNYIHIVLGKFDVSLPRPPTLSSRFHDLSACCRCGGTAVYRVSEHDLRAVWFQTMAMVNQEKGGPFPIIKLQRYNWINYNNLELIRKRPSLQTGPLAKATKTHSFIKLQKSSWLMQRLWQNAGQPYPVYWAYIRSKTSDCLFTLGTFQGWVTFPTYQGLRNGRSRRKKWWIRDEIIRIYW